MLICEQQEKKDWLRRIEKQVYGAVFYVVQNEPRAMEITKAALIELYREEDRPPEGSQAERKKLLSTIMKAWK